MMKRYLLPMALVLAVGCDSVLQTEPVTSLPAEQQIVDAATARASLVGAYQALQSASYYGLDLQLFGDLPADNATWAGTFQFLNDIGVNDIKADNAEVTAFWTQIYRQVNRVNVLIDRVPKVASISPAVRDSILGQAYFMRALDFHNLVKFWAGVPMPLVPVVDPSEASAYTRATVPEMYTQILADLDKAQTLVVPSTNTRTVTPMAIRAIRARVLFYKASSPGNTTAAADYAAALAEAEAVLAGRDALTEPYANLFAATGANTTEDIFRIVYFGSVETNSLGNYYLNAGRHELTPTANLNAAYTAGDTRKTWNIRTTGVGVRPLEGAKYRTRPGTEHVHVIRLAEVMLIKAEVLARQGNLPGSIAEYNKVRVRAGLAPHVLGVDVTDQASVILAIEKERRLELFAEGDRWPDLVRLGRAAAVKSLTKPGFALLPIPLREVRTTNPPLAQNPDY
jgi:starch-binding outer membrane protein, SusD/RagB family